jgi:hypothetical protein
MMVPPRWVLILHELALEAAKAASEGDAVARVVAPIITGVNLMLYRGASSEPGLVRLADLAVVESARAMES